MPLIKRTSLGMIASAVLIAGCGGGDSPKAVASSYFKALATGDYKTACDKIAAAPKRKLQAAVQGKSCPDVLSAKLKGGAASATLTALKDAKIGEPTLNGDRGSVPVTVKSVGKPLPLLVVKEDGAWKVESGSVAGG